MTRLLLALTSCALFSCVSDRVSAPAPRSAIGSIEPETRPVVVATEKPAKPVVDTSIRSNDKPCQVLPGGITLPYYVTGSSIVVIGFLKGCETNDGHKGFVPGSPWTAMGFPCTAGHGRIDKKGSDSVPSVITFHLQNSCPMQPGRQEDVEQIVRQKLSLPNDSHLIAYYPLSVDYWEFADFGEHDVGFRPEFYSPAAINTGWQKFSTKGEPLKIRLYGRENAWERGKQLYEIHAMIMPEGRSSFRLQVQAARPLEVQARNEVKDRCEALRPKRNCDEVFVP